MYRKLHDKYNRDALEIGQTLFESGLSYLSVLPNRYMMMLNFILERHSGNLIYTSSLFTCKGRFALSFCTKC